MMLLIVESCEELDVVRSGSKCLLDPYCQSRLESNHMIIMKLLIPFWTGKCYIESIFMQITGRRIELY